MHRSYECIAYSFGVKRRTFGERRHQTLKELSREEQKNLGATSKVVLQPPKVSTFTAEILREKEGLEPSLPEVIQANYDTPHCSTSQREPVVPQPGCYSNSGNIPPSTSAQNSQPSLYSNSGNIQAIQGNLVVSQLGCYSNNDNMEFNLNPHSPQPGSCDVCSSFTAQGRPIVPQIRLETNYSNTQMGSAQPRLSLKPAIKTLRGNAQSTANLVNQQNKFLEMTKGEVVYDQFGRKGSNNLPYQGNNKSVKFGNLVQTYLDTHETRYASPGLTQALVYQSIFTTVPSSQSNEYSRGPIWRWLQRTKFYDTYASKELRQVPWA